MAAGCLAAVARAEPVAGPLLVHARSRTTWIYPAPRISPQPLGYVRAGHALERRDGELRRGQGCAAGWVAVEPRGFVCLDSASLDEPRYVRALRDTLASAGPLDFGFALSSGTPAYRRLPSAAEAAAQERPLGAARRFAVPRDSPARAVLSSAPFRPTALPWFLQAKGSALRDAERELVRRLIPVGSTVAYTRSFEAQGRSWLLSTDGSIVPADRVQLLRRTSFHGVELDDKLKLPLFWLRERASTKYVLQGDAAPKAVGSWAKRSAVPLDPAQPSVVRLRRRYLKTREALADGSPLYVLERDATVVSEKVSVPADVGSSGKWLQFSVSKGTLVAYVGARAVFTTLASPGLGDASVEGQAGPSSNTTPLGTFRISVKHLNDDMGPEVPAEGQPLMAEVPYAQYFDMPFAIHVAYWHESFGDPMSGGCINVAPLDGERLFGWTTPTLPPDWDAVLSGGDQEPGTLVRVVR